MAGESKAPRVDAKAGYIPPAQALDTSELILGELRALLNSLGRDARRNTPQFQEIMTLYKNLGGDLHLAKKRVEAVKPPQVKKAETLKARSQTSLLGKLQATKGPDAAPSAVPNPHHVAGASLDPSLPWDGVEPLADQAAPNGDEGESVGASRPDIEPLALPKFLEAMGPDGKPGVLSMGEEVANLQRVLTHLGYPVEETEIYDAATTRAVRAFQKDHGLEPGDMVGADMRALLNQAVTG